MGIQPVKGIYWPDLSATSGLFTPMLIDAVGEKAAFVFGAPKAGVIDRVGFHIMTLTTPGTLNVRLETLDASGQPSGTLVATGASFSYVPSAVGWQEVVLTTPLTVTDMQVFAVVIELATAGNISVSRMTGVNQFNFPYSALYTGTWAKSNLAGVVAVRYNDGDWPYNAGLWPISSMGATTHSAGNATSEFGNKATLPFGCQVEGLWGGMGSNQGNGVVLLYAADGSTIITFAGFDGAQQASSNNTLRVFPFPDPVILDPGQTVYPIIRATSSTVIGARWLGWNPGVVSAVPGGDLMRRVTRAVGGTFAEVADSRYMLGFVISGIHDGVPTAAPAKRWLVLPDNSLKAIG